MSNTHLSARRLARWFLINLMIAAIACGISGHYSDPWIWTYIATVAAISLYPTLRLDDELAKERFHPPDPGADRLPLRAVRLIALAHIVVSLLDVRWQLSHVPDVVRLVGLVGMSI
jgi:hypothetical protein